MQDPEYLANREFETSIKFNGHLYTLRSIFDDDVNSSGDKFDPIDDGINDKQPVTFNDVIKQPDDISFNDIIDDTCNDEYDNLEEPESFETLDHIIIECVH